MKDKTDALEFIIKDSRSGSLTKTGLKKLRKAGKLLGLTETEQVDLERMLEYRDGEFSVHEGLE